MSRESGEGDEPGPSEEYRDLESLWLLLAQSHELTERATDFIREVDRPTLVWKGTADAPFDRDLELAVIDGAGPHVLVFPCRRILADGWMRTFEFPAQAASFGARGEEYPSAKRRNIDRCGRLTSLATRPTGLLRQARSNSAPAFGRYGI
jgi:hypothetical protein